MIDQLSERLGFDLSELAGAHVAADIPVAQPLLNRLLAAKLATSRAPLESLTVEPLDRNAVLVHVRLRAAFVPPFAVRLEIEEQPRFPESPVLLLRWSVSGLGLLSRVASPVLSVLDVLPPGISVNGDRIAVNVAAVLEAQGHAALLPLLARLDVSSEPGRLVVHVEARVAPPAG